MPVSHQQHEINDSGLDDRSIINDGDAPGDEPVGVTLEGPAHYGGASEGGQY